MPSPERTTAERLEVAAPGLAAAAASLVGVLPRPLRARALQGAFDRAAAAFNRGDLDALFALFADDVDYVPPPALRPPDRIRGRDELKRFWRDVLERHPGSTIVNLSLEEAGRNRFVRTARLTHGPDLVYDIRQLTEVRRGRVVRQVNEAMGAAGLEPATPTL